MSDDHEVQRRLERLSPEKRRQIEAEMERGRKALKWGPVQEWVYEKEVELMRLTGLYVDIKVEKNENENCFLVCLNISNKTLSGVLTIYPDSPIYTTEEKVDDLSKFPSEQTKATILLLGRAHVHDT